MPEFQLSSLEILRWNRVSFVTNITEQTLIHDITISFSMGERIGIIGANGAGKSTFLRLSNHLLSPSQGEIYFQQQPFSNFNPLQLRREIVLILQEPKLLAMTVKQALIYPLELQKLANSEINQRLTAILDTFSLPDSWLDKKEGELSLGQRQLIAIARAVILKPKVLLLDEPTSALDGGKANKLRQILFNLSENEEILIIAVNHQLDWIKQFATRVILLDKGKLVQDSPATEIDWEKVKDNFAQQIDESDFNFEL